MASINVTSVTGIGQPDVFTGLDVQGTATAGETVKVYYEIPNAGVMSSDLPATVQDSGAWSVQFNGEFSGGTKVTVYASMSSGGQASQTVTLPSASTDA